MEKRLLLIIFGCIFLVGITVSLVQVVSLDLTLSTCGTQVAYSVCVLAEAVRNFSKIFRVFTFLAGILIFWLILRDILQKD